MKDKKTTNKANDCEKHHQTRPKIDKPKSKETRQRYKRPAGYTSAAKQQGNDYLAEYYRNYLNNGGSIKDLHNLRPPRAPPAQQQQQQQRPVQPAIKRTSENEDAQKSKPTSAKRDRLKVKAKLQSESESKPQPQTSSTSSTIQTRRQRRQCLNVQPFTSFVRGSA